MQKNRTDEIITDYMIEKTLNPQLTKHYEGVFAQGSGYLQIRGIFEEGIAAARQDESYMRMPANVTIEKPRHPRSKCGTYIPGITGTHPLLKEEIVNLPNPLCFFVSADGERLDMDECNIKEFERRLNLKSGVLVREFVWTLASGKKLRCEYVRYVSRTIENLVVQKMFYFAEKGDITLHMKNDIDENVKTNGYEHFSKISKCSSDGGVFVEVKTDHGDSVRIITKAAVGEQFFEVRETGATLEYSIEEGKRIEIQKMSLCTTSRDSEGFQTYDQLEEKLKELWNCEHEIYKQHIDAWKNLWEQSEVKIKGDEKAQNVLNFSIYHLLRAANEKDNRIAICAKGFAGEAYFGHFFWDTEIYLLPFYLYTQPKTAKMLEEFRIQTLEGAKKNAKAYGYSGARYPWESGLTGEEQCPNWQYADHEIHITADVVFGLWHYFQNTGDMEFLEKAAPVFLETSKYWMERITTEKDGTIHINGVMGPDEYICFCNDNAYTNFMVAYSLQRTSDVLRILGRDTEYCALLKETAEKIVLGQKENGVLLQCSHFEEFEEPEFARIWKDRNKPFGYFISQEKNYRTKALKQADVLMLFYLFEKEMNQENLEVNYQYYLPYTTHDSSLSRIIHAILCCKRQKSEEAYQFMEKAMEIDTDEAQKGAAEGIHIANCGGIWQAVIFGFCGLLPAYEAETPEFHPALPKHWEEVRFPLFYKGKKLQITVTKKGVQINE